MVTRLDVIQKKEVILRLAGEHGARDVRLFGSVARDESTPSSDVDLLVRMDRERSLLDRIALIQDLQEVLRCNVDVVNDQALAPSIRDQVLAEAVTL